MQRSAIRQNGAALNDIAQFTNVARPVIGREFGQRGVSKLRAFQVIFRRVVF